MIVETVMWDQNFLITLPAPFFVLHLNDTGEPLYNMMNIIDANKRFCFFFSLPQTLTSVCQAPWSYTIWFPSWRSGLRFWRPRPSSCQSSSSSRRSVASSATSLHRRLKWRSQESSSCPSQHTTTSRLQGENARQHEPNWQIMSCHGFSC